MALVLVLVIALVALLPRGGGAIAASGTSASAGTESGAGSGMSAQSVAGAAEPDGLPAEDIQLTISGREVTATLSGITVPDSMQFNDPETKMSYVEWNWSVYFSDGVESYRVICYYWKQEEEAAIGTFDDLLYHISQWGGDGWYRVAEEVSVTHANNNITWRFTLPAGKELTQDSIEYIGYTRSLGLRDTESGNYQRNGSGWTFLGSGAFDSYLSAAGAAEPAPATQLGGPGDVGPEGYMLTGFFAANGQSGQYDGITVQFVPGWTGELQFSDFSDVVLTRDGKELPISFAGTLERKNFPGATLFHVLFANPLTQPGKYAITFKLLGKECGGTAVLGNATPADGVPIVWQDACMEAVARELLERPTGEIYPEDLDDFLTLSFDFAADEERLRVNIGAETYAADQIEIDNMMIAKLDDLQNFRNATQVQLYEFPADIGLSVLKKLPKLEALDFGGMDSATIMPQIQDMRNITNLGMVWCGLTNEGLQEIAAMDWLTSLSIFSNPEITDITPLGALDGLTYLDIFSTGITDISVLAGLPNLYYVDLRYTEVADLSPVAHVSQVVLQD